MRYLFRVAVKVVSFGLAGSRYEKLHIFKWYYRILVRMYMERLHCYANEPKPIRSVLRVTSWFKQRLHATDF